MSKYIFMVLALAFCAAGAAHADEDRTGSFYNWGRGQDGWGHCYQWASNGGVLNNGQAVPNVYCEQTNPSHFEWGHGLDGYTHCYQWTPNGMALNNGQAVPNMYCQ